jgi:CBS domain-containing protein
VLISEGEAAMHAMDVMATEVIPVDPDPSVQALPALRSERGISGVPVVDADYRVVGVVSEGDLLHHVKTRTDSEPGIGGHGGATRSRPIRNLRATMSSRTLERQRTS